VGCHYVSSGLERSKFLSDFDETYTLNPRLFTQILLRDFLDIGGKLGEKGAMFALATVFNGI